MEAVPDDSGGSFSSDPSVYLPWSSGMRALRQAVECSPCSLSRCPLDHRCMTEIPVERVVSVMMEVVQEVLAGLRMTEAGG